MAPLVTLHDVLYSTIIFVVVWRLVYIRVKKHGPVTHADKVLHAHSWVQVAISIFLLSFTLLSLAPEPIDLKVLGMIHANDAFLARYSWHCSRIFEYVDIIIFVASGNTPGLQFGFHHLTTPYLTYFRFINDYKGWQVFAGLNGFHHVLMHMYFAGITKVQPVLSWTRYIQLIVGIVCDLWIIGEKVVDDKACVGYAISAVLLSCYMILLTREIRMKRSATQHLNTD